MSAPKTIIIVGGGLAGLTLGIGLRQRGVPVRIHRRAITRATALRRICQRTRAGNSRRAGIEGKIDGRGRNRGALRGFLFWRFDIAFARVAVARALPFAFCHG